MTDELNELSPLSDLQNVAFESIAVGWTLGTNVDAFLAWLDDAHLAQDTEDALAAFMDLPAARQMPATLKDDLRSQGYEV